MTHSIISWDCCFRNFFHLIGSLARQEYSKDQFEFIFVEQWSREKSDRFNHGFGLKSLGETAEQYKDQIQIRVLYLNLDSKPYHLGITNNAGILAAKGKFISVMDGDLLVRPDFLTKLESAHRELNTVINLDRRYALAPAGASKNNWMQAKVDFDLVLNQCKDKDRPVPDHVENKGPMISAPAEWWKAVGGYDEHSIWSTGVSRLGQDVTARLELHCGKKSRALPGEFCVHPYHPVSFDRGAALEKIVLGAQNKIITHTKEKKITKAGQRNEFTERIYQQYKWAIDSNIYGLNSATIKTRAAVIDFINRGINKAKQRFRTNFFRQKSL